MITFVCWKWKSQSYRTLFTADHANVWRAMLSRHYPGGHRAICVTDDPDGVDFETFPLWRDGADLHNPSGRHLPSCYRRMRLFSSDALAEMDVPADSWVVSMDLDVVMVRNLSPMFDDEGDYDFRGWKGIGSWGQDVYNGTLFKFRVGKMDWMWNDFNPDTSPREHNAARYFGSDQGWMSYKLQGRAPGWNAQDGMLSFTSDMAGGRAFLPGHARIVSFNGKMKPWDPFVYENARWIRDHWRL